MTLQQIENRLDYLENLIASADTKDRSLLIASYVKILVLELIPMFGKPQKAP